MPEQDTKTPTVPAPSAPTRAQASDEMGSVAFAGPTPQVRRLVLIPVIGAVIILGVDIVLALQTSAWQLFAAAGFLAIGLALAFRGQQLARRGKFEAAGYWLLAGVSIAYGGAELVLAGMTVYITIGGLLMIVFVTGITRPGKWKAWLIAAGLYAGYILLVNLWQSPLRYDVSNLTIVNLFIIGISVAMAAGMTWQIVRAFQSGQLRTRLLIAFTTITVVPLIMVGGVSSYISTNNARAQKLNQLASIAQLKESEINNWLDNLQFQLNAEIERDIATQRIPTLLVSTPMSDDFRAAYTGQFDRFKSTLALGGDFDELFVIGKDGHVLLSTDVAKEGTVIDVDTLRAALLGPYIQPIDMAQSGRSILALAPYKVGSTILGVIGGRANLNKAQQIMDALTGVGKTGATYLVDTHFYLVTNSVFHSLLLGELFPVDTLATRTARQNLNSDPTQDITSAYSRQDTAVLGVARWLPNLGVILVAEQNESEVLAANSANLAINIGLTIFALAIAVIAALLVTRSIADPIGRLASTASRIAGGELGLTADIARRDEVGALAESFNSMTSQLRGVIGSLEERITERTEQLNVSAEVARAVSSILDPDELLQRVTLLIVERFNLYYAAAFLVDDDAKFAVLREATGEAGRVLKERSHQLEITGPSMVGRAIVTRQPCIVQDVDQETVRFANPLLTETKSEVALPLIIGDQPIGALDVQSTRAAAFDESTVLVLQGLADQIAIAVNNARQYQAAQSEAHQATLLFEASHLGSFIGENLIDVVHRLLDRTMAETNFDSWLAATYDPEADAMQVIAINDIGAPNADVPINEVQHLSEHENDPLTMAIHSRQPVVIADPENDPRVAHVPLVMRKELHMVCAPALLGNHILGVISLRRVSGQPKISAREVQLAEAIASQFAIAIENRRLLEQSQKSLEEMNRLMRLYMHEGWTSFSQSRGADQLRQEYTRPDAPAFKPEVLAQIDAAINRATTSEAKPISIDGQSMVSVPIELRGEVFGALTLQDSADRQWTEDELTTLQAVADQVAQSIEAARLLEESESSLQETTALYQGSRDIMAAQTPAAVLHGITANIAAPQIDRATLALIEPDSPRDAPVVRIAAAWERNNDQPSSIGIRWDITQLPLLGREASEQLIIDDIATSPEMDPLSRHVFLEVIGAKAVAIIPMYVGGRQSGWLLIESQQGPYHFTDQDIRRFRTLAGQATIALENRRLFEDVEARVGELTVLTGISRRLASTLNLNEVLALIADEVLNVTPATHASLALYNEHENALQIQLVRGSTPAAEEAQMGNLLRAGTGLHGRLIETGQSVLVADVRNEPDYVAANEDTVSEFIVPIRQGDLLLGALNLESPKPGAFDQANVRLVEALADQAAIAITNARSYEAEREAVERIREVDRLKTQFLANMSHELRTPLNSIIGFSRVIMRGIDGPLTELQSTDLLSIYNSGQHLLGLINNILDLSKIEAGKMEMSIEPIDLHDIAKSVMATAIALVKDKTVKLEQEVPESLPIVNADPTRVRQIILNLVSNAAKFTEQGFIRLRILPMPTEVQISVTDSGIGIPPSKLNSIFEEFTQADASTTRRYGGTGLGLAITRKFVEMHKGRVWVESQEGVGSTFTFTLPLEVPEEQEPISLPVDLEARGDGKKLIMCIDDDPGVITLYKRYLEKQGYQIIGITDSSKAVEEARRLLPFAITLDVLMPNRDGWSVLADLKSAPEISRIPIVVCSIIQDKTKGFSLGAADYLVKPITEDELLRALEHVNRDKNIHRVLVVDDEPVARLLIKRILEGQTDLEVLEAPGGAQALADVVDLRPDLIILDLMMPDIDGFTVLDNIKSNPATRNIPVIIVTAKEITEEDRHRLEGKTLALFNKGMFAAEQLMTDIGNALKQMNGVGVEEGKVTVNQ